MTIGFDVSQTGKAKAGCGYFADGLIRELAATDSVNEYILYPAIGDLFWDPDCATSTFQSDRPNFRRLSPFKNFEASRTFWRAMGPDFERRIGSPDIVHANSFFCPSGITSARLVYTLYDLSFMEDPTWTTEANRIGCLNGVFRASQQADMIVAISEYSRSHFLETFPHYDPSLVRVIYPASRFEKAPRAKRPERFGGLQAAQFWLSVGTIEPRKNHFALLDAYRALKDEGTARFPLVLAGGKGWLMDGMAEQLEGLDPDHDLICTGYVTDDELRWLYENCAAMIYPSLFEGFGMPVLEALSLGAPVLCSHTSSLPEVGGDAAIYFDPGSPLDIAAAMRRFAAEQWDRNSLKDAALRQAADFSWRKSAAALRELYELVATFPRGENKAFAGASARAAQ
jgi:glycosyltransferase involved in cell wall biosynthesis